MLIIDTDLVLRLRLFAGVFLLTTAAVASGISLDFSGADAVGAAPDSLINASFLF